MKAESLTEGAIFQNLVKFALPMMAGNLLQQVYNLVDTYIVGRYIGSSALGAVGSAYTLMIFITSIIIGLCMGSGALFSASYGAGDMRQLKQDIWLSFWFITGVTVLLYLILYPGMNPIQRLLHVPASLMKMTTDYVSVVFAGIFFVFLYNFYAYILRSMGESLIPFVFLAISAVINVVLDIFFVVNLDRGVKGAAEATVIAQMAAGVGIAAYARIKKPVLRLSREDRVYSGTRMKEIMINDIMTGIQQSVMNFGILMIQGLVNSFGEAVMAAFAAAVKIDTVAYMPAQEFGNAYSLFISQNYGAKKNDRIKKGTKAAMAASIVFCIMVSVVICVFARNFMEIFIDSAETGIIGQGMTYLRIEGSMYVGIGILFLWYGYFRGMAKPQVSLILTIISLGLRVLISYTCAPYTSLGVMAIWLSIPTGWIVADIVGFVMYRNSRKKGSGKIRQVGAAHLEK